MAWDTGFEVDVDSVRPLRYLITKYSSTTTSATITVASGHKIAVGYTIHVEGISSTFDGQFTVISVTSTTIEYALSGTATAESTAPAGAAVYTPNSGFLRYNTFDTVLDSIAKTTTFYAEPWDYHTIRILCGFDSTIDLAVRRDLQRNLTPRIAICRSAFGYPSTPIDGEKIVDIAYEDLIPYGDNTKVINYIQINDTETYPDGSYKRPILDVQGIYDRNLPSGRWYYYTLFVFATNSAADTNQIWIPIKSIDALTPIDYGHGERMYDMIPPYHQYKDEEFTYGTGQQGVLKSLLDTIGFEIDYTKTLAEGVENTYNIDYVHDDLLYALGEMNFGVHKEDSLGDIRYRAILSTASNLYDLRGSAYGIQKLISAASKYRTKSLEGINILNLTDDAEFASGTGSWGDLHDKYSTFVTSAAPNGWGTDTNKAVISRSPDAFKTTTYPIITDPNDPQYSLVPRQGSMILEIGSNTSLPTIIACGLGTGSVTGRNHEEVSTQFYPKTNGVRCTSGKVYTFSFYASTTTLPDTCQVAAGVMWFNDTDNFVISTDFLSRNQSVIDNISTDMTRYTVDSEAPISTVVGRDSVYAVPYIYFSNSTYKKRISACMFNIETNSAADYVLNTDVYITLNSSTETIGSQYIIGVD
jgi:hypothetical protein